jgi:hypothetical protein
VESLCHIGDCDKYSCVCPTSQWIQRQFGWRLDHRISYFGFWEQYRDDNIPIHIVFLDIKQGRNKEAVIRRSSGSWRGRCGWVFLPVSRCALAFSSMGE